MLHPPELTNRVGQYLRAFGDVIMSTDYGVGSRPQGVIAVWQSRYSTAIQKVCWGQRLRIIQVRRNVRQWTIVHDGFDLGNDRL